MKPFVYKYQTVDPLGRYTWETKTFPTQKELFCYLVENKELVIAQKKSICKRAEAVTFAPIRIAPEGQASKSIKPLYENNKEAGTLKRTLLVNTYWWLDSHDDVHIGRGEEGDKAIFSESIKNRAHKIFPIDQHNYSLDGRMGKTLALYEAPISWRALGVGRTGMTEGLFADAEIQRSKNERRYQDYMNDEIDQHSVGMYYNDVQLAVNDPDDFPKESKVFEKYIGKIGNRQKAEAQGYFFAVEDARLGEYSAVIAGSNELTPTMNQSSGDSGKGETSGDESRKVDINKLLNFYNPEQWTRKN